MAREVELLPLTSTMVDDELIAEGALRGKVESDLRDELDACVARGAARVAEAEIIHWLEDRFTGCLPLAERLGFNDLSGLWSELDWLRREGTSGETFLMLAQKSVFGRMSLPEQAARAQTTAAAPAPAVFREALAAAVDGLRQCNGAEDPLFGDVISSLRGSLGRNFDRVVGPDGGKSLRARIEAEPGWELTGKRPHHPDRVRRTKVGSIVLLDAVGVIEADGKEPTLAMLGSTLRKRLGDDYESVVGPSLKRWVQRQPGWQVREERPGHEVARALGAAAPAQAAVSPRAGQRAVEDTPDIAADITEVARALMAQGREVALTEVGQLLRSRWGTEVYRRVTTKRRLQNLAEDHGWEIFEPRPDVRCLRASDVSGAGGGGTQ
ncbi:hypothetical protein GLX30_17510 [Streptomyces sp. Tu 2975]|uniref:hypothetical protein n=1 Tax=Streptomyces sp. Tu 2975 TaxID=2676871 RepID=UPI00135B9BF3|nr:hypothetical protein [Streptomyces sp. Tu 2975]QIP85537.1 hypothetical protein GLX30_17510 [Streptomyces sp. Tu 2975]